MKKILAAVAIGCLSLSGAAVAQTCTSAETLQNGATVNGDTCAATNQVNNWCGSSTPIGAAFDVAYQVDLEAVNTPSITVTPAAGYDVYLGLAQGSCTEAAGCPSDGEAESGGAGVAETITLPQQAAGTYFLLVTSVNTAGCGAFTVAPVSGLPVALQEFTII
jgi:hypothetical protein